MSDYNKIRDLIVGLEIFLARGGYSADAQHDILYAGQASGVALTPEEIVRLKAASWFYDSDACTGEDCGPSAADDEEDRAHSPDCTGWAIFT